MADAADSKSAARKGVGVRLPPPALQSAPGSCPWAEVRSPPIRGTQDFHTSNMRLTHANAASMTTAQ